MLLKRFRLLACLIVLLCLLISARHPCRAQTGIFYTVTDLNTLGGDAVATGINDSGQIVGNYSNQGTGLSSGVFLWRNSVDGMIDIAALVNDFAYGLNDSTQICGTTENGGGVAYLWDPTTGIDLIGTLGGAHSNGYRVNNYPQVCGATQISTGAWHAYVWDPARGISDLNIGDGSSAYAINANGDICGQTGPPYHAFLWTPTIPNGTSGTWSYLREENGDTSSLPLGVNASRLVVGYSYTASVAHALLWDPTQTPVVVTDLGGLGGSVRTASAINNLDQVVGQSLLADNSTNHAFIWDSLHGMLDLNTQLYPGRSDWTLQCANSINASGYIVGYGLHNSDGHRHAFLLTPTAAVLTLSPNPVTGGSKVTGTITLSRSATVATTFTLASNSATAKVPANITIPAGSRSKSFNIATTAVAADTKPVVTATLGTISPISASLTVKAPVLTGLTLNPTSVKGGKGFAINVTLSGPTAADTTVSLSAVPTATITVPKSVTVTKGHSAGQTTGNTQKVTKNVNGRVTAKLGGSQVAQITVTP
jgi:probable HAF family extracellular repeat protein